MYVINESVLIFARYTNIGLAKSSFLKFSSAIMKKGFVYAQCRMLKQCLREDDDYHFLHNDWAKSLPVLT